MVLLSKALLFHAAQDEHGHFLFKDGGLVQQLQLAYDETARLFLKFLLLVSVSEFLKRIWVNVVLQRDLFSQHVHDLGANLVLKFAVVHFAEEVVAQPQFVIVRDCLYGLKDPLQQAVQLSCVDTVVKTTSAFAEQAKLVE